MNEAINKAIEHFGSMAEMARQLELSSYTVIQQWKTSGRVPAEHCPRIERLCNGAVRCESLNDRVDWAFIRTAPNKKSAALAEL